MYVISADQLAATPRALWKRKVKTNDVETRNDKMSLRLKVPCIHFSQDENFSMHPVDMTMSPAFGASGSGYTYFSGHAILEEAGRIL